MGGAPSLRCLFVILSAAHFFKLGQTGSSSQLLRRQYDADEITVDDSKHDEEFFTFVTRPDIDAPKWNITLYDEDALAPGYWFVGPYGMVEQTSNDHAYDGPHIYDSNGDLIWSGAPFTDNYASFDFRVNRMHGEPILSFITPLHGAVYMLDSSYQPKKNIHVGETMSDTDDTMNKKTINIHDFTIHGDTYTLLTRVREHITPTRMEEFDYDGACTVEYPGFIEADLDTDKVLFEWNPRPVIPLEESYVKPKNCDQYGWDYIHLNSVDKLPDGDYLVSARHTYTIYKISHKDGSVVWRLNGKNSDFVWADHDRGFLGQHDARFVEQNDTHLLISVLDNAVAPGEPNKNSDFSRGMIMALRTDTTPMTAEVVSEFIHPDEMHAFGRGDMQLLPNGNAFIGWSGDSAHSEHAPDGRALMDARLPCHLKTYRSYKFPWVGRPSEPPTALSQAVDLDGSIVTTAYVSWNGATEVASWNLYKSTKDGDATELIASRQREGFETAITHRGYSSYVVLEAIDRHGKKIGKSEVVKTTEPSRSDAPEVVEDASWLSSHFQIKSSHTHALSNPIVAFISGIAFCAAALLSAFAFWHVRRNGLPSLGRYRRVAHASDYTDEEEQTKNKGSFETTSSAELQHEKFDKPFPEHYMDSPVSQHSPVS